MNFTTDILALFHRVDGYQHISTIFDDASNPETYNMKYGKLNSFKNYTFGYIELWDSVDHFFEQDGSYVAQQVRKELDPEYSEYLRLKEKFG